MEEAIPADQAIVAVGLWWMSHVSDNPLMHRKIGPGQVNHVWRKIKACELVPLIYQIPGNWATTATAQIEQSGIWREQ